MKYLRTILLFAFCYYTYDFLQGLFNFGNVAFAFPLAQIEDLVGLLIAASVTTLYVSKNFLATDDATIKKMSLWIALTPIALPLSLIGVILLLSVFVGGVSKIPDYISSSHLDLAELVAYRGATTVVLVFFIRHYLYQQRSKTKE